tara:strand:- start:7494 stop:8999 length:1506 start_codon:yes stop_codon:yes gene_type:complete
MNILIHFNSHLWEDHLSQMIELGLIHKNKKDKIFITFCEGSLLACPANYYNKQNICKKCINQQKYTINNFFNNVTLIKLNLSDKNFKIKENIKSVEKFKKLKYRELPIGKLTISTIVTQKADIFLKFSEIKHEAYNIAENSIKIYEFTKEIIKKHKINIAYSWNGRRTSDGPILYAAKKNNIKFFAYTNGGRVTNFKIQPTLGVHNLKYSRNLIKKIYKKNKNNKKFYKIANYFFSYMRYGGKKIYGREIYSQLFDNKKILIPKNKKVLTIFTSSYWEFFSLHDKEWETIDQFRILDKILNDKELNKKYNIIIRWHPNQRFSGKGERKAIDQLIRKNKKIIHFDYNSSINSYKLLENSDVILSFGSTIGIEATYYNKPSICFGSAFFDQTGGVYIAKSYFSLRKKLLSQLKPLPKINALKFAYHEMEHGNIDYKNLKIDKFNRYFYNSKRIKKHNIISYLWEILKNFYSINQNNIMFKFLFYLYKNYKKKFNNKGIYNYKI